MSEVTVDPTAIPKDLTDAEKEYFILFAICVAGKSAKQTQEKLNQLLNWCSYEGQTPFQAINNEVNTGTLGKTLRLFKMGQYKRIEKAFEKAILLDIPEDLTVEKLEAIPGIGPKTARFIVLYTDPAAECVPLDTHILKYLREQWPAFSVPKSTPPAGKKYKELEELFQYTAKRLGKSVRQLDTEVWRSYART